MYVHNISVALSLREARGLWKLFGGLVEDVRRTGEERYSHPNIERPITVNKRRKDAPRKLAVALRRLADNDLNRWRRPSVASRSILFT